MTVTAKITTLSSRQFQQNADQAQQAAQSGPVFITSEGKPAYVLLSIEAYRRITGKDETRPDIERKNIGELLYFPGAEDVEFEIPKVGELPAADLDFASTGLSLLNPWQV